MPFYEDITNLLVSIQPITLIERPLRAEHKRVSLLGSLLNPGAAKGEKNKAKRGRNKALYGLKASMTVEAAMALPLYIFFLCNVIYVMEAVRFQSNMSAALHETGMRMCEYAYYVDAGSDALDQIKVENGSGQTDNEAGGDSFWDSLSEKAGSAAGFVLSETYVRSSCSDYLEAGNSGSGCVEGGSGGISYLGSAIPDEKGCIEIRAQYRIKPFIPVIAPAVYTLENRFYAHPFTGYDVSSGQEEVEVEEEDEMVYITTKSTSVYHKSRSCSYLLPSMQTVPASGLGTKRNENGAKYYACELCHPASSGTVIITSDGTRYHRDRNCSALYRDIMEVPLKEVRDTRHACSRCGG